MKLSKRHLILCHNPLRVEEYAKERGWSKREYTHVHYTSDLLGMHPDYRVLIYLDCNYYNSSRDLMEISDYAETLGFKVEKIENPELKLDQWHQRPKVKPKLETLEEKFDIKKHGRF